MPPAKMLRARTFWSVILALMLVWLPVAAHAQTFPALAGKRVVDAANIIPDDQEPVLEAKLKALEETTDRQMVVATVPDLQGYPIEDYGYRLGRALGLGQKEADNGAILLVAPAERKVRIEIGYGLEPILTDALSSVIINTQILPQFKGGNMPAGIMAGTDAMLQQLKLPPDQAAARAKQIGAQRAAKANEVDVGAIIFWLFIFFFFILPILRGLFGGKRGKRHGSAPVIIWGGGSGWGGGGSSFGSGGGSDWGGFSGGGGSFGGGGASGDW